MKPFRPLSRQVLTMLLLALSIVLMHSAARAETTRLPISPAASIQGDISGNGTVSDTDAWLLREYLLGKVALSSEQRSLADLTGDNKLDIADVLRIHSSLTEPTTRTATIGSSGGSLSKDGVTITIPAGLLKNGTVVTLDVVDDGVKIGTDSVGCGYRLRIPLNAINTTVLSQWAEAARSRRLSQTSGDSLIRVESSANDLIVQLLNEWNTTVGSFYIAVEHVAETGEKALYGILSPTVTAATAIGAITGDVMEGMKNAAQQAGATTLDVVFHLTHNPGWAGGPDPRLNGWPDPQLDFDPWRKGVMLDVKKNVVIYVHGVLDSHQSFKQTAQGLIGDYGFEKDPAANVPPLNELAIWVADYDYYSPTIDNGAKLEQLIDAAASANGTIQNIYIVAHSMGGMVTRRALQAAQDSSHPWLNKVRAVAYLAVMHDGTSLEVTGSMILNAIGNRLSGGLLDWYQRLHLPELGLIVNTPGFQDLATNLSPSIGTPANVRTYLDATNRKGALWFLWPFTENDGWVPTSSSYLTHDFDAVANVSWEFWTTADRKVADLIRPNPFGGHVQLIPSEGVDGRTVASQIRKDDRYQRLRDFLFQPTVTSLQITSKPVLGASVGVAYDYPVLTNASPTDTLTFSLTQKPTGMTISTQGVLRWTPGTTQAGQQNVTVQARNQAGQVATQIYKVTAINSPSYAVIAKGLAYLKSVQQSNGSWTYSGSANAGITGMAALAFLDAGYPDTYPTVASALTYLKSVRQPDGSIYSSSGSANYETAMAILPFIAADKRNSPRKYTPIVMNTYNYFAGIQNRSGGQYDGGWRYKASDTTADMSVCQWVALALFEAFNQLGYPLDHGNNHVVDPGTSDGMWAKLRGFAYNVRTADGGFGYDSNTDPTVPRTSAGIWSLVASGRAVDGGTTETTRLTCIQGGFDWLASNYASFIANPSAPYYYYGLASFSKACVLGHIVRFGTDAPWYETLQAKLTSLQNADGSWASGNTSPMETSFALSALATGQFPPGIDRTVRIIVTPGGSSSSSPAQEKTAAGAFPQPEVHIYDQQGRHTGPNDQTGEIELGILGVTFEIVNGQYIITLPNPAPRAYHIELTSTANAIYDLRVEGLENGDITSASEFLSQTIRAGETQGSELVLTSIVGSMSVYVTPPSTSAVLKVVPERVHFTSGEPGSLARLSLTVMETANAQDLLGVTFVCSDLAEPGGGTIMASNVFFEPNSLSVPKGGSHGFEALVQVPSDTTPGLYSGSLTVNAANARPKTVTVNLGVSIEMVSVPSGTFTMGRRDDGADGTYGSSDEIPRHQVTLSGYQIGKYEVTNGQMCNALGWALGKGYIKSPSGDPYTGGAIYIKGIPLLDMSSSYCQIEFSGGTFRWKSCIGHTDQGDVSYLMENHPVVEVSWYGAMFFCNWLSEKEGLNPCYDSLTWGLTDVDPSSPGVQFTNGYRLPTEAEWERAAAWDGTKHWIYGFASDTLSGKARCNYEYYDGFDYWLVNPLGLLNFQGTSPVGWFNGVNISPNGSVQTIDSSSPVGCYDMSGNVSEWCQDTFAPYSADPQTNPIGPLFGGAWIYRGGSYWGRVEDSRTAWRLDNYVMEGEFMGFRVARTPSLAVVPSIISFSINGGANSTTNRVVTLNNACSGHPTALMASESSDFVGAIWQSYSNAPLFTIFSGSGVKTVFLKVMNAAGVSVPSNASITLSEAPGPNVFEMVNVPGGTFTMGRRDDGDDGTYGSSDELPRHQVTLSAYQIGKYEVTNAQMCNLLNWALGKGYLQNSSGGAYTGGDLYANSGMESVLLLQVSNPACQIQYSGGAFTWKSIPGWGNVICSTENHPVVNVTWYGAVTFCNWLSEKKGLTPCYNASTWELTLPYPNGYRLPTEAEWERAAAWDGTKHWIYGFVSDTLSGGARCNGVEGNLGAINPLGLASFPETSPVGWFDGANVSPNGNIQTVDSPSPAGCYDMSGNVMEWCHDQYGSTYYSDGAMTNPTGPASGDDHVVRGGGWWDRGYFDDCRSAARGASGWVANDTGFRLARTP